LTWLIFRSYSQHQSDAAERWKRRGEEALRTGNAKAAVFDLRAALGYAPEDHSVQVELAGALAKAGRLQEATAYFNTLWETEPGNGDINLQLARLAAAQKQTQVALEHYHAAIYGVWEGDGAIRRRQVRLELVRFLIQQNRFSDARDELLIAAGNDTTTPALLEVAGLLATAHAPSDALHIYHEVAGRRPVVVGALEGTGQMAFTLARYRTARTYLEKALAASSATHPLLDRTLTERNLKIATAVLDIFPSQQLTRRERMRRVLRAREVAHRRFSACMDQISGQNNTPQNSAVQSQSHDQMNALSSRWQSARPHLTVAELADNAQLEQAAMQLVYDTEQITQRVCGEPTGEDATLLRIAASPETVDQ
jgi:tetratricopeptide (TPR) repeat protein